MPHFIVECSRDLLLLHDEGTINRRVHRVATASGLFEPADIKVRVNPFDTYLVGGEREDFLYVFAWIMEGRSVAQRAALSKAVVEELAAMFPSLARIAMNVAEFEKATYVNRAML